MYGEIDLNRTVPGYFVHETTGHYWPKQFRVYFDDRELKRLNILAPDDTPPIDRVDRINEALLSRSEAK